MITRCKAVYRGQRNYTPLNDTDYVFYDDIECYRYVNFVIYNAIIMLCQLSEKKRQNNVATLRKYPNLQLK